MTTQPSTDQPTTHWHRVLDPKDLPEGRVTSVTIGNRTLAITHVDGQYGALDGKCPHQGGPLGWGTIENGVLRCPWHGYDYDPLTGEPPPPFADCATPYEIELRDDGLYVALPADAPQPRTVSDVLAETMINWGVDTVFGMIGSSNLGYGEAMHRLEDEDKLTYIGVRHEGAASFAASAYAKLSGKPAACFGIAGPGATNLLTGLWDAKMDRAPILALTGQVGSQVLGPGAFQEIDLTTAFSSVSAWSQTVLSGSKHTELMNLAVKHAILQRGVGHLILPDEVQVQALEPEAPASGPEGRLAPLAVAPPQESLEAALAKIGQSQRPVIIVGHGARFHMDAVVALAERLNAPVYTTFKAKGLIPDNHPLGCGVIGHSGTPIGSWFMNEADLLVVFGASFSNHTGITPYQPTIQIDTDPLVLGKTFPVDVPVVGDIGVTAELLLAQIPNSVQTIDQRPDVESRKALWLDEKSSRADDDRGQGVAGAAAMAALNRHVPDNAVITVDVGNNTYSFGRYFECTRQSVLMSGYLGSIGFAYPAALGAWAAAPDRPIVAIAGDGGFAQYLAEVTTAVKYKIPIKAIIINNSELGRISTEQRAEQKRVWQTSLHNPDFAAFARNCGAFGIRVESGDQLDDALAAAFAHDGPALVDVVSDPQLV